MRIAFQDTHKLGLGFGQITSFQNDASDLKVGLGLRWVDLDRFLELASSISRALHRRQRHAQSVVARRIRRTKIAIAMKRGSSAFVICTSQFPFPSTTRSFGVVGTQ